MGLYKRTDSPYWWMHLDGTDVKESTRVPVDAKSAEIRKQQRDLALEIYRARMGDIARSAHRLPARRTTGFRAMCAWYEENVLPTHRGAEREREILPRLLAFFGDVDLLTITRARVTEYATHRLRQSVKTYFGKGATPKDRGRTVSANTVNREIGLLKSIMAVAVPKYFAVSPLAGMPLLRVVKPKKRILEPAEETRLLAELDPADRAFYLVAIDSLMRLSNVIDLRRDEDKGDHFALIDSKTGPYEAIVSPRVRTALDALPTNGEYYFPHRRVAKTQRDRRGAVRLMLKRACQRANITYGRASAGITFHTGTRATGATRMMRAGHDLTTVQAIGNWRDVRSMAEYLHTSRERMHAAVSSIGRNPDVTGDTRDSSVRSIDAKGAAKAVRRRTQWKKR